MFFKHQAAFIYCLSVIKSADTDSHYIQYFWLSEQGGTIVPSHYTKLSTKMCLCLCTNVSKVPNIFPSCVNSQLLSVTQQCTLKCICMNVQKMQMIQHKSRKRHRSTNSHTHKQGFISVPTHGQLLENADMPTSQPRTLPPTYPLQESLCLCHTHKHSTIPALVSVFLSVNHLNCDCHWLYCCKNDRN